MLKANPLINRAVSHFVGKKLFQIVQQLVWFSFPKLIYQNFPGSPFKRWCLLLGTENWTCPRMELCRGQQFNQQVLQRGHAPNFLSKSTQSSLESFLPMKDENKKNVIHTQNDFPHFNYTSLFFFSCLNFHRACYPRVQLSLQTIPYHAFSYGDYAYSSFFCNILKIKINLF